MSSEKIQAGFYQAGRCTGSVFITRSSQHHADIAAVKTGHALFILRFCDFNSDTGVLFSKIVSAVCWWVHYTSVRQQDAVQSDISQID